MTDKLDLRELRGCVATVCLTGQVEQQYAECLMEMRSWCDRNEMHNVEWKIVHAVLVEAGRDQLARHMLSEEYDWLLQIDADATFQPDTLYRLLHTAYSEKPDSDAVGAYAQLKSGYLPTIDTGTGTWEPHFPDSGVMEVIRTGAHCLLTKASAFQRFGPPWFRSRRTVSPARALAEVDNFARMTLDGRNPFMGTHEWTALVKEARKQPPDVSNVGEDSGFCDALRAAGGTIYVDTRVRTGHIERHVIGPEDLRERLDKAEDRKKQAVGVME